MKSGLYYIDVHTKTVQGDDPELQGTAVIQCSGHQAFVTIKPVEDMTLEELNDLKRLKKQRSREE